MDQKTTVKDNQQELLKILNEKMAISGAHDRLIDMSSDGIVIFNNEGIINDCNNEALNVFDCDNRDEIIGKSLYEFIPPDIDLTRLMRAPIGINGYLKTETLLLKKNGISFPAKILITQTIETGNDYAVLIQDITSLKILENTTFQQVEILAKQSIINYEISQIQTVSELKTNLCNQCLILTEARETWFLSSLSGGKVEFTACNTNNCSQQIIKSNPQLEKVILELLSNPSDLYTLSGNLAFKALPFELAIPNLTQLIIGKRTRDGNWNMLGLNYDTAVADKSNQDSEFLRTIFTQVFASLDGLANQQKLIENETRFRTIIEKSDNLICVLDKDLVFTYVSPSISNYQYTTDDLLGKKAEGSFTHPEDRDQYLGAISQALKTSGATIVLPSVRHFKKDGSIVYSTVDITNLLHQGGVHGLVMNFKDITERVENEKLIRQSEEKFRDLFNNSNDSIYIADLDGRFLEVNKVAIERTGVSREDFLKTSVQGFISKIPVDKTKEFLNRIISDGSATAEESYTRQDGVDISFQVTGRLIDYEGRKAIVLRSLDITERKRFERQIFDAVINTEEKERARFARELHDGIGPYLSAIKFFLQTLSIEENAESRQIITSKAMESIDEVIRNVKDISNNISPRVLNHFGIIPAINNVVKKLENSKTSINIKTNVEGIRFNENIEINIFRIFSELINNSLKHSKATKIEITILKNENVLFSEFVDNGIGFNYNRKIALGKGSGLYNIGNRVNALNGKFDFLTEPGQGLKFRAYFEIK